jgi:hypothetical protein
MLPTPESLNKYQCKLKAQQLTVQSSEGERQTEPILDKVRVSCVTDKTIYLC